MITSVEVEKRSSNYNAHSLFKKRKLRGKIEIFLNLLKHNYKNKQLKLKKKKLSWIAHAFYLRQEPDKYVLFSLLPSLAQAGLELAIFLQLPLQGLEACATLPDLVNLFFFFFFKGGNYFYSHLW